MRNPADTNVVSTTSIDPSGSYLGMGGTATICLAEIQWGTDGGTLSVAAFPEDRRADAVGLQCGGGEHSLHAQRRVGFGVDMVSSGGAR